MAFKSSPNIFHTQNYSVMIPVSYIGEAANGRDRTGSPMSGGQTCIQCHVGSPGSAVIDISVIDFSGNVVTEYDPGETYEIHYNITGNNIEFAMQSVAISPNVGNIQAGDFNYPYSIYSQTSTLDEREYFEQTHSLDAYSYTTWQAPAAGFGDVDIYMR